MEREIETTMTYLGDKRVYFSSNERKWINRLHELHEQHPDEVTIRKEPEDNDGVIYATFPASYIKLFPKKQRTYTEEQRESLRMRLADMRKKKMEDNA